MTGVADSYDLAVIGTGSAGSGVASRCARAGWRVAILEAEAPGGTCALRGCDPKKVLVGAAETVDAVRRLRGKGPVGTVGIDWAALAAFKRSFTDPYPAKKVSALEAAGVTLVRGAARFVGRSTLDVNGNRIGARHVLIATGAVPRPLAFPGAEHVMTSDRFLDLEALPSRIIFIGGGFISFEFAHVAVRAGAQVTVLHRGARPLARFEPDLVERLVASTRELGIDVRTRSRVTRVEAHDAGVGVWCATDAGAHRLEGDLVVHGAGRVPALHGLGLDAAGVAFTDAGVTVDDYLQSVTNPSVWAAGDAAASGPPLTPVAGYDASVVAHNLLNGRSLVAAYPVVPSVVFTIPPLASVGLSEAEARVRGLHVTVKTGDMSDWYSSRRLGASASAFKTLVDARTGAVAGAHLLGPHAEETINLFALAMRVGMPAAELRQMLWAYPTHGSDTAYML